MNDFLKLYIQLLKYDRSLKKDGTSLREQDRDKYLKLLNYSVKLSDHVHWQQKNDYLNIMKSFVDLKIDGKQFRSQFDKLHGSNEEAVKILETDLKQLNTFEIRNILGLHSAHQKLISVAMNFILIFNHKIK